MQIAILSAWEKCQVVIEIQRFEARFVKDDFGMLKPSYDGFNSQLQW